jgi:hypothetical protein
MTVDDPSDTAATFLIEFADYAGNPGIPIDSTSDATSVAVDTDPPELSGLCIESSDGVPSNVGHTITVTLASDEPMRVVDGMLLGREGTVDCTAVANTCFVSIIVHPDDPEGDVDVSIVYCDNLGNCAAITQVAETMTGQSLSEISTVCNSDCSGVSLDGTAIPCTDAADCVYTPGTAETQEACRAANMLVDTTTPFLPTVKVAPDGPVASGEVISVSFAVSERLQSLAVSIAGNEIACPSADCLCTWTDQSGQSTESGQSTARGRVETVSILECFRCCI